MTCSVEQIVVIGGGAAALACIDGDGWASIFREVAEKKLRLKDK